MSNIANKAKDAIAGRNDTTGTPTTTTGARETHITTDPNTTTGPHRSDMANRADPSVDTGRERRGNPAVVGGGTGLGGGGGGMGSTRTTAGHGHGHGAPTEQTTGVTTGTYGAMPVGGGAGPGVDSHATTYSGPAPNTAGPHKSDLANKLDPRVDSNLDGSRTVGGGDKTYSAGGGAAETNTTGGVHQGGIVR